MAEAFFAISSAAPQNQTMGSKITRSRPRLRGSFRSVPRRGDRSDASRPAGCFEIGVPAGRGVGGVVHPGGRSGGDRAPRGSKPGGGYGEYDLVSRGSSRTGGAIHRCEVPRTGVRSFVDGATNLPATRNAVDGGGRGTNEALGFDAVTLQGASREFNVSTTWSR